MIARPMNWDDIKEPVERQKLNIDAAVCRIIKAAVQNNSYGDQLCIVYDIAEGEYSGYYQEEFNQNTFANKKWKGVLRLWLPKNDGSEKDEWSKRTLKGFTTSIEKSNPGYVWNWDENSLKNKLIGVLYRDEAWEYEGKTGWAKRPFRAISIDSVREGNFDIPKAKSLQNKSTGGYGDYSTGSYGSYSDTTNYAVVEDEDSELPF